LYTYLLQDKEEMGITVNNRTTITTVTIIPETDSPIEALPSFLAFCGFETAQLLAIAAQT